MRPKLLVPLGVALVVTGLAIALATPLSVWRLSGQVLDELPPVSGADATDDRDPVGALLHADDFVLATRDYEGTTIDEIEQFLDAAGFEATIARGHTWWSKPCCGSYDAVWVRLVAPLCPGCSELGPHPRGDVLAVATVADNDAASLVAPLLVLGSALATVGLASVLRGVVRWRRDTGRSDQAAARSEAVASTMR